MPLTRNFRETAKARADADPAFRAGLYQEAVQAMLDRDFGTANILLRDVIDATSVLSRLASHACVPEKSDADVRSGGEASTEIEAEASRERVLCGSPVSPSPPHSPPAPQPRTTPAASEYCPPGWSE